MEHKNRFPIRGLQGRLPPKLRTGPLTQAAAFPRRHPPGSWRGSALSFRGRRECRVPAAPTVSARKIAQKARVDPQVQPGQPGIPRAVVYGLLRALLGEPDFVVTVISAMRMHRRQLSAGHGAPGPHGFAVRITVVRPATMLRPPHPALNVRDDAYAPHRGGTDASIPDF